MINIATHYSIIEMGGRFDGIYCWIVTDCKEPGLDFHGS
jgi:hypothetical protein